MYRIQGADQKEYGPISADQIRQWISENRLNRFSLCAGADGIWKPLGQFLEFSDLLGQATSSPPPTGRPVDPAPPGAPVETVYSPGGDRSLALSRVKAPAICMLVLSCFSLLNAFMIPLIKPRLVEMMANQPGMNAQMRGFMQSWAATPSWVGILLPVIVNGAILFGSIRMMSLRSFGFSMAAAILTIQPCGSVCCCIGIPLGIWAAITLNRADVKPHFLP